MTQQLRSLEFENPDGCGAPWTAVAAKKEVRILNPNGQLRCTVVVTEEGQEISGPLTRNVTDATLQRIADVALNLQTVIKLEEL